MFAAEWMCYCGGGWCCYTNSSLNRRNEPGEKGKSLKDEYSFSNSSRSADIVTQAGLPIQKKSIIAMCFSHDAYQEHLSCYKVAVLHTNVLPSLRETITVDRATHFHGQVVIS